MAQRLGVYKEIEEPNTLSMKQIEILNDFFEEIGDYLKTVELKAHNAEDGKQYIYCKWIE